MNDISIYSCASSDLNKEVLYYQKLVFEFFNLEIQQIIKEDFVHGLVLDNIIKNCVSENIIIFDVDCIPLKIDFLQKIIHQIKDGNTLSGAVGCANHIDSSFTYIHSCFMAFKKQLYLDCGTPSLNSYGFDTCGKFTQVCIEKNKNIKYWNITDRGDSIWDTPDNGKFGHGTVYENLIYDQYEIRKPQYSTPFIKKCKEIINK